MCFPLHSCNSLVWNVTLGKIHFYSKLFVCIEILLKSIRLLLFQIKWINKRKAIPSFIDMKLIQCIHSLNRLHFVNVFFFNRGKNFHFVGEREHWNFICEQQYPNPNVFIYERSVLDVSSICIAFEMIEIGLRYIKDIIEENS